MQSVATTDPEAYDYYLRGRNYMYSMARRDYEHAIRMFDQAIKLDSKYALAYAGLADAYSHMYRYVEATAENVEKANRASEQAVVLPRLAKNMADFENLCSGFSLVREVTPRAMVYGRIAQGFPLLGVDRISPSPNSPTATGTMPMPSPSSGISNE